MNRRRTSAAAVLALALATVPVQVGASPRGNNGTIKIDGAPWDSHPNNEPHVGCEFQLDFAGFDRGDLHAHATFSAQSPTSSGVLGEYDVFIGEDTAGGANDNDATIEANLSEALWRLDPHPNQGWHVKVTVYADGSRGADTKHKTFWVKQCDNPQ